mgnify:CR=1 FL=1
MYYACSKPEVIIELPVLVKEEPVLSNQIEIDSSDLKILPKDTGGIHQGYLLH